MFFGPFIAAGLLSAALIHSVATHEPAMQSAPPEGLPSQSAAGASERNSAPLGPGDPAPDFAYQSSDYLWQNLHNVLEQGSVLLVFVSSDDDLRAIERQRDGLVRHGIVPLAVVERRDGDAWTLVRRLDLTYSLLADPRQALARQFGVSSPRAGRERPEWFVIDVDGMVRASGEGAAPAGDWSALAIAALGGSTRPASAN